MIYQNKNTKAIPQILNLLGFVVGDGEAGGRGRRFAPEMEESLVVVRCQRRGGEL